jgi:hypothetical protein
MARGCVRQKLLSVRGQGAAKYLVPIHEILKRSSHGGGIEVGPLEGDGQRLVESGGAALRVGLRQLHNLSLEPTGGNRLSQIPLYRRDAGRFMGRGVGVNIFWLADIGTFRQEVPLEQLQIRIVLEQLTHANLDAKLLLDGEGKLREKQGVQS